MTCDRRPETRWAAVLSGYTNAGGTASTIFSVMEKIFSDAQKMRSASEKSAFVLQNIV
jgi:hypothetical protein